MAQHEMIFVGEYHDHIWGHKIEFDLLVQLYNNLTGQGSTSSNLNFAVSLEMFERDTQSWLSGYLSNQISESCFLDNSRPWPNYKTDYAPLVEFVKKQQSRQDVATVLASNIPRRYAAFVSAGDEAVLFKMPGVEQSFMAPKILAPHDQYYTNFYDLMKPSGWDDAKIERFYRAQCIKDDTMAMSISQFFNKSPNMDTRVISYTGSFHVDYRLGLVGKVRNLLPESTKIMLLSIVPIDPQDPIKPGEYKTLADIVIFAPENQM